MKLAVEHIQHTIALTERSLEDTRNARKAVQQQIEAFDESISASEKKLIDLRSALAVLGAQTPMAPVEQLQKTPAPVARKAKQ